ncbi:hypothetical protein SAMN04488032_10430 [Pacificibacter marinus]|uniref:Uncharacterized protein n=1 Tax=Pacificibacter marinus TaxID=658057 RepID=A0A1Y5SMW6_9RHOB|nr:hypothetical protein SAMN04488032_10430 [Pacificibacter marinus]SLN42711.1 hypothetical protein PAM7971_02048 [Pacificibacter marinus]
MTAGSGRASVLGREESPDSIEQQCRVTPGGGNPRDSATENRPPYARASARWGKGETVE